MLLLRLRAGMDHFARGSSGAAAARHDARSDEGGRGADAAADCGGGEGEDEQKQGKQQRRQHGVERASFGRLQPVLLWMRGFVVP